MRKIILILLSIMAGLAVLLVITLLALRHCFNPNTLIAPLSSQIQQKTGLILQIEGPLSWHIFPKTSIAAEKLSLRSAAFDQQATNIQVQSLRAHLALWPLITQRKMIIDDITLDGLDITLPQKTKQNFTKTPLATTTAMIKPSLRSVRQKNLTLNIKSLTLTHVTLRGLWEKSHPDAIVYLDNLTLKNLNSEITTKAVPIDISARIADNDRNIALSLQGDLAWDLYHQAIRIDRMQARVNSLQIQGNINATQLLTSPQWQGQLTLDDNDATTTLPLLSDRNIAFIKTLHSEFTLNANQKIIDLSPFNLTLNGEAITGSLHYDIKQHHLLSSLNANTLHWPDFHASHAANITKNVELTTDVHTTDIRTPKQLGDHTSRFSVDNQMQIQHLLYQKLSLDNVKGQLHYENNTITLNPITATMLQGIYQGKIILDTTHTIQMTGTLSHLNLALLQQALGKKPSIAGLLDAKGSLNSQGKNKTQRLSNLNGQVSVVITKGVWTHLNVPNILSFLNAAGNSQTTTNGNEFSSASGIFNIRNGIATNPNLKLTSALLTAKGDGSLDLIAKTLHYKVMLHPSAVMLKQIHGLSKWVEQDIPLTVKGPWEDPKIKVEHSVLIKNKVEDQLGNTLKTVRDLVIIR